MWILVAILVITATLLATRRLPIEVTAVFTVVALALTGLLSPAEALSGFSSPATLTVGAMFVLSAGLLRTGALEQVTIQLARFSKGSPRRLLGLLGLVIPPASAFVNNTPVVVMMIPVVLSLSRRFGIRPSKLLMPVSYFAVLGGTMTLLGTSTNILVDDLYRKAGGPGFGLFDFTPLGVIYTLVGGTFIVLAAERLLPDREPLASLAASREGGRFVTEVVVGPESAIQGRPVATVFRILPGRAVARPRVMRTHRRVSPRIPVHSLSPAKGSDDPPGVELLEIFRGGRIYRAEEARDLVLQPGDALLVAGSATDLTHFLQETRTELASALEDEARRPIQDIRHVVVEAVVLPESPANRRMIPELGLFRRYGVRVLGLQRGGIHLRTGLRRTRLRSGDVLLLQGEPQGLRAAADDLGLMLVEGVDESILRRAKNRVALVIMAGVVLLATLSDIPIVILALAGAALLVVTRCLRVDEALRALDASTLMLLVGTIPLGRAMETTGLAHRLVMELVGALGDAHPVLFLSGFYLFTSLLTQILSNNAVAVLLTPIALTLAGELGISPTPLLMAVAFGASASFLTPIGYQTNAIVMGPGGYTFADYLRLGIPLTLICWLTASLLIPVFWPF